MLTSSAKNKGRELENFVVKKLRDRKLDPRASRNPGSGSGHQKGDIWNSLGLCIECKNTKKNPGREEFEQVKREAMGYATEVLIWHVPNTSLEDSRVIININDWLDLLQLARQPKSVAEPSRTLKYKLENLKRSATEILKELE